MIPQGSTDNIIRIIGIGVDLASIERVNRIVKAQNVLTVNEYNIWSRYNEQHKKRYLATRWAAKEAVFKALPKLTSLINSIKHIETLNHSDGKPYVSILPKIKSDLEETYGNLTIEISLTHERDTAAAFCIAFSSV